MVNGKQLKVNQLSAVNYKYDQQGRISLLWYETPADFKQTFIYAKNALYIETRFTNPDKKAVVEHDTITLNGQGLQLYLRGIMKSPFERVYDADGYLVDINGYSRPLISVQNRNLVNEYDYFIDGIQTRTYTYDLTQSGLYNKYQYLGKNYPSVNLETKMVLSIQNSALYREGPLYTIYSYYKYDQYGRITCRIRYSKDETNSGYPYRQDGGGLGVTYYEYECP